MKLSMFRRQPTPADLAPVPAPAAPKPGPGVSATLTPPPAPAAARQVSPFRPGRYVITYGRFGPHGVPEPGVFTLVADSVADLAEQVHMDITPFLGNAHRIKVTVDLVVSGGKITYGSVSGTFTFARGGMR